MKRLIYYIAALATLAFVGCSKDAEWLDSESKESKIVRFTVNLDQGTRVNLDDTKLTWTEYDELFLYRLDRFEPYYSSAEVVEGSISEDGKSAEFSVNADELVDGSTYIAVSCSGDYYSGDEYYLWVNSTFQSESGSDWHIEDGLLIKSQTFVYDENVENITDLYFTIEQSVLELDLKLDAGSYQFDKAVLMSDNMNFCNRGIALNPDGSLSPIDYIVADDEYIADKVLVYLDSNSNDEYPTISNTESYKLYMPIYWADSSVVSGKFKLVLSPVSDNSDEIKVSTVEFDAKELKNGTIYTKSLTLSEPMNVAESDKAVLLKIYKELGGKNWKSSYGSFDWSEDTPMSEWNGVDLNVEGCVEGIEIYETSNMSGTIKLGDFAELSELKYLSFNSLEGAAISFEGVEKLKSLKDLRLDDVEYNGPFPEELCEIKGLRSIDFYKIDMTGAIPSKIGDMQQLSMLYINKTNMSGVIPEEITSLNNLNELDLRLNKFSGAIPSNLLSMGIRELNLMFNNFTSDGNASLYADQNLWNMYAVTILQQNQGYGFNNSFKSVYLKDETVMTFGADGPSEISTAEIFKQNKYTLITSRQTPRDMEDAVESVVAAYGAAGLGHLEVSGHSGPIAFSAPSVSVESNVYSEYLGAEFNNGDASFHIIVDKDGKVVSNPYITDGYTFDNPFNSDDYNGNETKTSAAMMQTDLVNLFNDADPFFAVSCSNGLIASPTGKSANINIYSNAKWSILENCDWITSVSKTSGTGGAEVTISFSENTTDSERIDFLTFTSDAIAEPIVIKVTQKVNMLDDLIPETGL